MDLIKIESINKELEYLEERSEILGTAIVNRNGLLITSRLPRDIDVRKFSAMASTMFEAINTIALSLKNKVYNISVDLEKYRIIILDVKDYILVSLLDLNTNLGLVLIEIEETIKNLKNLF